MTRASICKCNFLRRRNLCVERY